MKKVLILLLVSVTSLTFGQNSDLNRWSIGLNVGGSAGHNPIRMGSPKLYQLSYVQGNLSYMFNKHFGIMGSTQYNGFKIDQTGLRTNYINTQLHGIVNLGDMIKIHSISENLGLHIHGGWGFGVLWQKDYFPEGFTSPVFDKGDETVVLSFGATPKYQLSEKFSLNADLSFLFHAKQHRTFDFQHRNPTKDGINGRFFTVSFGATYHFVRTKLDN
jgi:OmpA-OmpF porin, OOP family